MRELSSIETAEVSGGLSWGSGGMSVMAIGLAGGPVTAGFGFTVGGAMLLISFYAD